MAEDRYESPAETPHFTTDEVSDADAKDSPSVAPDLGAPLGTDPDERAPDNVAIADEMTQTAIKGPHHSKD